MEKSLKYFVSQQIIKNYYNSAEKYFDTFSFKIEIPKLKRLWRLIELLIFHSILLQIFNLVVKLETHYIFFKDRNRIINVYIISKIKV